MVFEDDPDAAEPLFMALLLLYPFSVTLCVCVSAYYLQMEQFHMAQQIIEQVKKYVFIISSEVKIYHVQWTGTSTRDVKNLI